MDAFSCRSRLRKYEETSEKAIDWKARMAVARHQQQALKSLIYRGCPILFRHAIKAERSRYPERWNRVASEGFAVQLSWMPEVFLVLRRMERLAERLPSPPYITQVKEKFDGLRIYWRWYGKPAEATGFSDAAEAILARAENRLMQKG